MKLIKLISICFVFFISLFIYVSAVANDTQVMSVEANVLDPLAGTGSIIKIQISNYTFFGNVTQGEMSDEIKIIVNNTGNVDVTVRPEVFNPNNDVFKHLQLRKRKSGNSSTFYPIGQFAINITKPSSEGGVNDDYFYMTLDLTDYETDVEGDQMGRKALLRFVAMET